MIRTIDIDHGKRDPRLDPRPGDMIIKQLKRKVVVREVTSRSRPPEGYVGLGEYDGTPDPEGVRIHYHASHKSWGFADGAHLGSWIQWAKGAHVIRLGESLLP